MSGVIGSIGKSFTKVVKTAKKVLPAALAIGAIVFTAGAAMGALPSWGTAISGAMGKLGITGTLGSVLTGAVTQAGYGAVLGGATSALTGGKVSNGMLAGAAAGAITGGAMGAANMKTDPFGGLGDSPSASMPEVTAPGSPAPVQTVTPPSASAQTAGPLNAPISDSITGPASAYSMGPSAAPPSAAAPPIAPPPAPKANGLFGDGGWLEKNGTMVGTAVSGLGSGLLKMAAGDDTEKALKKRQEIYTQNYRITPEATANGLLMKAPVMSQAPAAVKGPAPRFDPAAFAGEYEFDPAQGKIVWKPLGGTA